MLHTTGASFFLLSKDRRLRVTIYVYLGCTCYIPFKSTREFELTNVHIFCPGFEGNRIFSILYVGLDKALFVYFLFYFTFISVAVERNKCNKINVACRMEIGGNVIYYTASRLTCLVKKIIVDGSKSRN